MPVNNLPNNRRMYRILYVGPEGAGKTTTVLSIHRLSREPIRGSLRYLNSRLYPKCTIDLLTLELGPIGGVRTTAKLYTLPGHKQARALLSRIYRAATCIILVADSQIESVGKNLDFIYDFRTNVMCGGDIDGTAPPVVYQFNKMDLPSTVQPSRMAEILGVGEEAYFTTAAIDGTGVFVPLKTAIERSIWFVDSRKKTGVSVPS